MKNHLIILAVLFSSACSAGNDFPGNYQRQGASSFEVNHNMNTSVLIEKQNDQYLVTFRSGYGNSINIAKVDGDSLVVNDLIIKKSGYKLYMHYLDNPDVTFTFKQTAGK